jgi:preprotein translocase subunit YajC
MPQGSNLIAAALPFIIMLGLFYIIILVPERKRRKKYNDMLEGMKNK